MTIKSPIQKVSFLLLALMSKINYSAKAQIPEQLNHIVYAGYTNFHGGIGFGLAYEHYLLPNKRLSIFVPINFGVRDYYVVHSNINHNRQPQGSTPMPESKNYSLMLHPGIKFYLGKNTSFLSYVIGGSTFLSYGTENGFKRHLDNLGQNLTYRYSAGNEIRWGGMFDQFLNFRISERILMEIQGSFGLVHYARFKSNDNFKASSRGGSEAMGLIGISFGCRL